MEPLSGHRLLSTLDLDEGQQFASNIWERSRSIVTGGKFGLRWNQVDADKISLSYIEHDCQVDLKAHGPLSDHFRIFFQRGGSIGHLVDGRPFVSHNGNVLAHSPGSDLRLTITPFQLLLLSMDGGFVRRAMEQRFRKLPAYRDWLGELPQSANLAALRSMTSWLAAELERPGSPLAVAGKPRMHAERLLLSLAIECLTEAAPGTSEAAEDISRTQVRLAEQWIDANMTDTIGVEEVAAAVGVGVRCLQMSFRRVHACTPQEFITRRRLETARQMLLSADADATVTAIAMTMGFFELGRFSQRYRQHFGEMPSATLARGRD